MEEKEYSVIAENISKGYKMYDNPKQKLLDLILPKGAGKTFYALKNISFKVKKGEVVGLLGLNGSGKSTLSNILGGVSMPTKGKITINGEASLIAIGLGMNNFLTGIENIEVKALMMGYKKNEIEEIKQDIIDFADVGEFINQPIRTYSSGMRSRLGFAISVYTNPDILVIDEALSVGDPTFTQKCLDKMNEFKEKGKTIFFVSHSLAQVKTFCNKAMWLEYGVLKEFGDIAEVAPKYQDYINKINKMTEEERAEYKRETLKNQDHSLLKDFKLVDKSLKDFIPKGRIIKRVLLINNKNKIKNVFYNIDISTIAFGFLPSLVRKRYETAMFIALFQGLNFFIIKVPFCFFSNFVVTGIASLFTAKSYLNYLVENKGYIPYNIWSKVNLEAENITKEIKKHNKKNGIVIVSSIACILIGLILPTGKIYLQNYSGSFKLKKDKIKIYNKAIVVCKDNKIESILILNSKGQNSLLGTVYPGKLQIEYKGKVDEIRNILKTSDIEDIFKVFMDNFKLNISDYVVITKDNTEFNSDIKYKSMYKNLILDLLKSDELQFNNKPKDIQEKYPNIDRELMKDFYYSLKDGEIKIEDVKYDLIKLEDIIDIKILTNLNIVEKKDDEFITIDKRILQNNVIVKDINKKYEEYLKNQESKAKEERIEEPIEEIEEVIEPIWQYYEPQYYEPQYIEPIENNIQQGEEFISPSNNGDNNSSSGESIIPLNPEKPVEEEVNQGEETSGEGVEEGRNPSDPNPEEPISEGENLEEPTPEEPISEGENLEEPTPEEPISEGEDLEKSTPEEPISEGENPEESIPEEPISEGPISEGENLEKPMPENPENPENPEDEGEEVIPENPENPQGDGDNTIISGTN